MGLAYRASFSTVNVAVKAYALLVALGVPFDLAMKLPISSTLEEPVKSFSLGVAMGSPSPTLLFSKKSVLLARA
jgi:hypothetical protein